MCEVACRRMDLAVPAPNYEAMVSVPPSIVLSSSVHRQRKGSFEMAAVVAGGRRRREQHFASAVYPPALSPARPVGDHQWPKQVADDVLSMAM